jgi:hypothetical protein
MRNISVVLRYFFAILFSILAGVFAAYVMRYVFVFGIYDGKPILTNILSYNIFLFLNAFFPSLAFSYVSFWAFTQSIGNYIL